jgi:hypothetical protein
MLANDKSSWLVNLITAGVAGAISIVGTSGNMQREVEKVGARLDAIQQENAQRGEMLARIDVRLQQLEKQGAK